MLSSLALYKSWIVFVGTFFLGESVVLAASALAAQGTWSVAAVAGWAFAGTVVSDTLWFRTARFGLSRWTSDPDRAGRMAEAARRIDRLGGDHPHRVLLYVKFLYGTRIASLAYLGARRVRTARFVTFDAAGTILWLAVMIPIGWFIGKGFSGLGADLRRAEWLILGGILIAAITKGLTTWRKRRTA